MKRKEVIISFKIKPMIFKMDCELLKDKKIKQKKKKK